MSNALEYWLKIWEAKVTDNPNKCQLYSVSPRNIKKIAKLGDLLKEIRAKCDDIKSDTEFIREYFYRISFH